MSVSTTCPTCGAALASDATRGACAACLLEAGFATGGAPAAEDRVPTPEELAPKFPGLVIEKLLGRGGMGVVYKARHKALDRDVALKILPERVAGDAAFAERFQREARAHAKLQHSNIVGVHDFGETDGLFWLVMEYVDGANVREAMRAGQIGPKEALAIVPQICDALQYAHEHGVVHRDIKPENILLDRSGRVKVADFGLAKLMEQATDATLTSAGQVMGTPHYMAPEQVERPGDVDHRADIYSLGVVFYEMLTGELPLGRFAPPSSKVTIDVRLDEVVLRTLEKAPERRYQHASDVKQAVTFPPSVPRREVARKRWRELLPPPPAEQVSTDRAGEMFVGLLLTLAGLNGWLSSHRAPRTLVAPMIGVALLGFATFVRPRRGGDPEAALLARRRLRRIALIALTIAAIAGAVWSWDESMTGFGGCVLAVFLLVVLFRRWNAVAIVVVILLLGVAWSINANLSHPSAPLLSSDAAARLSPEDFRAEDSDGFAIDLPRDDRTRIDALWRDVQGLPLAPTMEDAAALYAPATRARLQAMTPEDRARDAQAGSCGLPLLPRSCLSRPLEDYRLVTVEFEIYDDRMDFAFATATAGDESIRFGLERDVRVASAAEYARRLPWYFGSWVRIDK